MIKSTRLVPESSSGGLSVSNNLQSFKTTQVILKHNVVKHSESR